MLKKDYMYNTSFQYGTVPDENEVDSNFDSQVRDIEEELLDSNEEIDPIIAAEMALQ